MGAVDDVVVDRAPRTSISDSIPDCFLGVSVLDSLITFTVDLLFCWLIVRFEFLLSI